MSYEAHPLSIPIPNPNHYTQPAAPGYPMDTGYTAVPSPYYPGPGPQNTNTMKNLGSTSSVVVQDEEVPVPRRFARTPSPTPSEIEALQGSSFFSVKSLSMREKITYLIVGGIVIALVVTFVVFHDKIVNGISPAAEWLRDRPAGWLVPVAILFILSFPPLFGHEIIALLVGVVWGLWEGFGIVVLGTLLGESANFFVFKYFCSARGSKEEKKSIMYACLAKVVREGGLKVAVIVRYSLIPPHLTTAIFSTIGMSFWTFLLAAVLALPKQLVTVYLGTIFEQSADGSTKSNKIVSIVVSVGGGVVTYVAFKYVMGLMRKAKPEVVYERRKAREVASSMI